MNSRIEGAVVKAPLAGNAHVEGTVFDTVPTNGQGFDKLRAFVSADQSGTLNMQQSDDGNTWYTTQSQAIVAGTPLVVESLLVLRYARAQVQNGAIAQGALTFGSTVLGSGGNA